MTIQQIRKQLSPVKRVSRPQLYRYLCALNIQPLGARQRPQHYPDNAPVRILAHLGLRIVSMPQLREARRRSLSGHRRKR